MAEPDAGSSTPAPSAPAAAAPASSAPATTTSTSTTDVKRPASLGAALREAAGEGSSPSASASGEAPHATGTVLPTDASPTNGSEGPVPYPRFSEVNRAKNAAEEKLKALSWADGIDHNRLMQSIQWHARAQQNPASFLREIYEQAPPAVQAQMRNLFVPPQAARAPAQDPEPQPDIQTDTGVPVYSARQQALREQWFQRKLTAEFKQMVAPLQQESQRFQQLRDTAIREHQTRAFAQTTASEATEWPHFKEHVKSVVEELQKLPPGDTEAAEALNLHRAYLTVMKRDVLPGLSGKSEQAVLANLKQKAVAGSEHPGRASTSSPTRPKSMGAALRAELAKSNLR